MSCFISLCSDRHRAEHLEQQNRCGSRSVGLCFTTNVLPQCSQMLVRMWRSRGCAADDAFMLQDREQKRMTSLDDLGFLVNVLPQCSQTMVRTGSVRCLFL